jgi:hypothetical protein
LGSRIVLGLLLGASAAAALAVFHTASTGASAPPAVVSLREAQLPPNLVDAIRSAARADGVDPDSVVEVGGIGSGSTRRSVLVGEDANGLPRVSFFQGFGMTLFQPARHLFETGDPVAFSEGYSGPEHEPVRVGVVGAARESVDRVAIELGDGRVVDAPLATSHGLRFFAYAGDLPADFPTVVRAYGRSGALLQTHEIPQP